MVVINLKEYIVTLMAMFLSLGIGIMVGTSITESVVVEQQRSIIERLENRYFSAVEDLERLSREKQAGDTLLTLYDMAYPLLLPGNSFGPHQGREVLLISLDPERGQEVFQFLQGHGLKVNPHIVAAGEREGECWEKVLDEVFSLADFLLEKSGGGEPGEWKYVEAVYSQPVEAEALLVVLGGISLVELHGGLLKQYVNRYDTLQTALLEDYFMDGPSIVAIMEANRGGVIDFIDTTPGKWALLEVLAGNREAFPLKPLLQERGS